MKANSVLVTGSSGTIGTALINKLLAEGYDVRPVDNESNRWSDRIDEMTQIADLRLARETKQLPNDVDTIVHLAAHARVHKLVENPTKAQENFDMTFNILEHARKAGISNFILGSSREVYGNNNKIIYNEEDTHVDECESPYTASKIGSEAMTKSYQNCYDLHSCILRFSNVYGRYDVSDRVIPLFISQAKNDQNLTVYGKNKLLDFTYLDDCLSAIFRVLENFGKAQHSTFNIASGEGSSLLELAELIIDQTDSDSGVTVETNRRGEVNKYVADISKAKVSFGFSPEYGLAEGVSKTIDWYDKRPELLPIIRDC